MSPLAHRVGRQTFQGKVGALHPDADNMQNIVAEDDFLHSIFQAME